MEVRLEQEPVHGVPVHHIITVASAIQEIMHINMVQLEVYRDDSVSMPLFCMSASI